MNAPGATIATLKASSDFQRIAGKGKRWSCSSFILQTLRCDDAAPFRFGLTASRKVGNAVTRNRAKRRLREIVRLYCRDKSITGWEIVLIAKTAAASADFAQMQADFEKGLKAAGIGA